MWWSRESSAFEDQSDIAELFARSAGLAIHNVNARDNLTQAVIALDTELASLRGS
jgi:hypothetical protein